MGQSVEKRLAEIRQPLPGRGQVRFVIFLGIFGIGRHRDHVEDNHPAMKSPGQLNGKRQGALTGHGKIHADHDTPEFGSL